MQNRYTVITRKLVLLMCSLCVLFGSIKLSYFIGEKFFFDRLFYQKSDLFGYTQYTDNPASDQEASPIIKRRVKDLINLHALHNKGKNTSDVLGAERDNRFTIVLIGDSFVYGQGIKNEERFGELLEKELNTVYPTRVIILAQPGDSAMDNYAKFQLAYTYFSPDLYIIGLVDNDLVFQNFDKYPLERDLFNEVAQYCPGKVFMWFPMPNPPWEEMVVKQYKPSVSSDYQNICMLKTMTERMLKLSPQILFYSFYENVNPEKQILEYDKLEAEALRAYTSTVQQAGGYVIYQPNNSFYERVSLIEGHPSSKMNTRYAKQLYAEILSNPKWRFPSGQKH